MVRRKLKSTRGASVLVALLVLLVCVAAAAAALTAASANAGRYRHLRTDQQRYLAVASATRLVRDELADQRFTASAKVTESKIIGSGSTLESIYTMTRETPACTGTFADWLTGPLDRVFQIRTLPADWWSMSGGVMPDRFVEPYTGLGIQTDGDAALLNQVSWELSVEEDYGITANFWLEDGGVRYYPMTLTMKADVSETISEPETEGSGVGQKWSTTCTVDVTWNGDDAVITQIAEAS